MPISQVPNIDEPSPPHEKDEAEERGQTPTATTLPKAAADRTKWQIDQNEPPQAADK